MNKSYIFYQSLRIAGLIFGAIGSYYMGKPYLAKGPIGAIRSFFYILFLTITQQREKLQKRLSTIAQQSTYNEEDRIAMVIGLAWLFAGFLVATLPEVLDLFWPSK